MKFSIFAVFLFFFLSPAVRIYGEDSPEAKKISPNTPSTLVESSRIVIPPSSGGPVTLPRGTLMAFDQDLKVAENTPTTLRLVGASAVGTSSSLVFSLADGPRAGTLEGFDPNNGTLIYTPRPGFKGKDAFSFKVTDGREISRSARVSLEIVSAHEAPAAVTGAAGGFKVDAFTVELMKEQNEFQAKQRLKRREFFSDLREKNLEGGEIQEKIRKFRKDEIEREREFADETQEKINDHNEDERRKISGERKKRGLEEEPFGVKLAREGNEFFRKQNGESADFFNELQEMKPGQRRESLIQFRKKQREEILEFRAQQRETLEEFRNQTP